MFWFLNWLSQWRIRVYRVQPLWIPDTPGCVIFRSAAVGLVAKFLEGQQYRPWCNGCCHKDTRAVVRLGANL